MKKFDQKIRLILQLIQQIKDTMPPDPLANIKNEKTRRAVKDYLRDTPPLKQFEATLRTEHPLQIFGTCDHIPADIEDVAEEYRQELDKFNAWWRRRERIKDSR